MTKVNMLPAVFLISSCNSFVLTDPAIYINDYFFGFESDNVSAQAYSDSEYSFANIKIGRGPAANVVLAYVNDGIYEWRSNDGITIYTNNGIIVKTLGLEKDISPGKKLDLKIQYSNGKNVSTKIKLLVNTSTEITYLENGGILQYVMKNLVNS